MSLAENLAMSMGYRLKSIYNYSFDNVICIIFINGEIV